MPIGLLNPAPYDSGQGLKPTMATKRVSMGGWVKTMMKLPLASRTMEEWGSLNPSLCSSALEDDGALKDYREIQRRWRNLEEVHLKI